MSELRREPVFQRWVVIAEREEAPPQGPCPFCPGREGNTPPEIFAIREPGTAANRPGWFVRVVPDRSPFLRIEEPVDRRAVGLCDVMSGLGAHEIVVETPEHTQHWGTLPPIQHERILHTYRARMLDLRKDLRLKQIVVVKNYGASVMPHPHSHVIAFPVIPKRIDEELQGASAFYRFRERCVYCDMVQEERNRRARVILETDRFLAYAPYASRYAFEAWVVPVRHAPDFGAIGDGELGELAGLLRRLFAQLAIGDGELGELAGLLRRLFGKLRAALNDPPFGVAFHTAPLRDPQGTLYHWHIEVRPRLALRLGFEWATGVFINTTPPEKAAAVLREAPVPSP